MISGSAIQRPLLGARGRPWTAAGPVALLALALAAAGILRGYGLGGADPQAIDQPAAVATGQYGLSAEDMIELAPAISVLERNKRNLLKQEGVNGVSVGRAADGGPAILVFHENYAVGTEFPRFIEGVPILLKPCDGVAE